MQLQGKQLYVTPNADNSMYCKRLNFRGLKFSANRAKAENFKLFAGPNFRESNVASVVLTYCPYFSRDLFFANQKRFVKI
ncbi:MAG: hypothetical protein PV344_06395 [Anaplasma sp.]|nr:hypothetical protein [Anaplasma sp.]